MATPDTKSKDSVDDLSWLKLGYYTWYKVPNNELEHCNTNPGVFRFTSKRNKYLKYWQYVFKDRVWKKGFTVDLTHKTYGEDHLEGLIKSRRILKISKQEAAKIILTKKGIAQPCKLKHRPS